MLRCRQATDWIAQRWVWALACILLASGISPAASPRDELLKLVPEDVAFCFILQDLRGHAAALEASPFMEKFRASPAGKALGESKEIRQLQKFLDQLQKHLGLDWQRLRDDLLGDAIVFAYRPGPPGKPEQEQGLVLLRAREPKVLADLIDKLNKAQLEAGEVLGLETREHNGVKYVRRAEKRNPNFYCLRGPILVICGQEDMLRHALDRERATLESEPPLARRLRELGADRAFFAAWLNPRPFDIDLAARAQQAAGADGAFLKQFAVYWQALQDAAWMVHLDRDVSISIAFRAKPEHLPEAARRFLALAAEPSELWRLFPAHSLLTFAGKLDGKALAEVVADFLRPEARQAFRKDLEGTLATALEKETLNDTLAQIGPDWGWCLFTPESTKHWMPCGLVAIRLSPAKDAEPIDQALLAALNFAATFAVMAHNKQHPDQAMKVKSEWVDGQKVRSISSERGLPLGFKPTFGVKKGYLVLASSLTGFKDFASEPPVTPAAGDTPILRVSLSGWRDFLSKRLTLMAAVVAERNKLSNAEAGQRLDGLVAALQWFDLLEVSVRGGAGVAGLTLRIRTEPPLKAEKGK